MLYHLGRSSLLAAQMITSSLYGSFSAGVGTVFRLARGIDNFRFRQEGMVECSGENFLVFIERPESEEFSTQYEKARKQCYKIAESTSRRYFPSESPDKKKVNDEWHTRFCSFDETMNGFFIRSMVDSFNRIHVRKNILKQPIKDDSEVHSDNIYQGLMVPRYGNDGLTKGTALRKNRSYFKIST